MGKGLQPSTVFPHVESDSGHEETSDKPKLEDILQNNLSMESSKMSRSKKTKAGPGIVSD